MTKTAQGILLSTVLATITACGSTKPANTGTGGSGGAGGTSGIEMHVGRTDTSPAAICRAAGTLNGGRLRLGARRHSSANQAVDQNDDRGCKADHDKTPCRF